MKSDIQVNELLHRNTIFSSCMNSMQESYYFDFIRWLEVAAHRNCAIGWCSTDLLNTSSGLTELFKALQIHSALGVLTGIRSLAEPVSECVKRLKTAKEPGDTQTAGAVWWPVNVASVMVGLLGGGFVS